MMDEIFGRAQHWLDAYDWATDDDMPKRPLQEAWERLSVAALDRIAECEIDEVIVEIVEASAHSLKDFLVMYARRYVKFDEYEECDAALFWRLAAFEMGLNLDTFDLLYNRNLLEELTNEYDG